MKLLELETERSRVTALVERMKRLKSIVETEQAGDFVEAANQALGIVRSDKGRLIVQSMIAALVAEEIADLATVGADFDHHDYFPEVVFTGTDYATRQEGGPSGFVYVAPGAEASIGRALKCMLSVGGEYAFDQHGGIQFSVSRKQKDLPVGVTEL